MTVRDEAPQLVEFQHRRGGANHQAMAEELTGGFLPRFIASASVIVAVQDFARREFVWSAISLAISVVLFVNPITAAAPGRRRALILVAALGVLLMFASLRRAYLR